MGSRPVSNTTESVYRFIDDTVVCFCSSAWPNVFLPKLYPQDGGYYRFRHAASGYQSKGMPVTFRITGGGVRLNGLGGLVGYFDAPPDEPKVFEFVRYMEPKSSLSILPYGLASAQGGMPEALLEEMARAPELRTALTAALQAGLDVDGAVAVARARLARQEAMLALAAVEEDTVSLRLATGRVDDAYFDSLAAGAAPDRFAAVLGAALHRHTPPDIAVRMAREAASPLAAGGHRPGSQLTRTGP